MTRTLVQNSVQTNKSEPVLEQRTGIAFVMICQQYILMSTNV